MKVLALLRNQWDRVGAFAAAVGGAVALLLGYLGVSGTSYPEEQLPYLVSGGVFGLFLLGVAAVLWLTADLRDEWRKLDDIDQHLVELIEQGNEAQGAVTQAVKELVVPTALPARRMSARSAKPRDLA